MTSESDLTGLLQAWSQGDGDVLAALAPLVQQDLRAMARRILAGEQRDGRWGPTELVQESYLRLLDWRAVHWQNRAHFFSTAARMMRRVLVDAARERKAFKRGAGLAMMPLDSRDIPAAEPHVDVLALEDALDRLAATNARASHVVELRFSGGSAWRKRQKRWTCRCGPSSTTGTSREFGCIATLAEPDAVRRPRSTPLEAVS